MTGWTDEARAASLAARAGKAKAAGDVSHHQLKIAADTLRMPDAMAGVMGGPSKDQARAMADDHAAAQALSGGHPKSEAVPVHPGAAGPQYQHSTAMPGVPYNRDSAEPARSQQARELSGRNKTQAKLRKGVL